MFLESSFTPDVIAYCPPATCQPIPVHAIGLMQIYWEVHQNYDYESLKTPLYNCRAAYELYLLSGWGPWPHSRETVLSQVARLQPLVGDSASTVVTEPGVSLAADIEAAPQASAATLPPAPQPQQDVPPPYIAPTVVLPQLYEFGDDFDGWDNVIRYYKRDLPTYVAFDDALNRILATMTGDVP